MMKWSRSQMVGSTRSHIFMILIYILCLVCVIFGQSSNDTYCAKFKAPGMTIPSGDIIIEEGKNLDIYCMLSDRYMSDENHFNSSDLVFSHNSDLLPLDMIQIVNATTIHLHIENMTSSYSDYYCKFKNGSNVCYNKVAVDRKPRPVKNIECFSNNLENLTCTCHVPKHYVKTKYDLSYIVRSRVAQYSLNCPQNESEVVTDNVYRCVWTLATDPMYRLYHETFIFTMVVSNIFGNASHSFEFNHYAHMIPSRAEGLSVTNITAYSAAVQWNENSFLKNFPSGLIYRLSYQSQFDDLTHWKSINFSQCNKNTTVGTDKDKCVYPLMNLNYANARYDIKLTSCSGAARGNNSWAPDATFSFHTESDLPNVPPKTDIGSFEIRENNNHREIFVYWQQIQKYQENGNDFRYTVVVRQNNTIKSILPAEPEFSYWKYIELGFGAYDFEIFSTNELGNSTASTFVRVPSLKEAVPEPLSFTKIVYGKYTYELSWIPPKTKQSLSSYTIFWCNNLKDWPYQCTGLLSWTRVSSDITIWNITMKEDGIFQFAISANTKDTSSGMVWASCTVIHNKVQGKMKNLYAETKGSTVIEVNWKLDCSGRIGIVTGFRIYYCPIQKQENPQCIQPEKNITVTGDVSTVVGNLTHLIPFTLYRINVAVVTRNDEGPKSDTKFAQTFETSPDMPRNVSVIGVTNTTITIAWEPPTSVYGVLRYFEIRYVSLYNRSDMNRIRVNYTLSNYFNKPSPYYTKMISGLRSFNTYNIDLVACTIACSESYRLNKTTSYGVPDKMSKITTTFLNSTRVLEWVPPATPGGPNMYQLLSEYIKDGVKHSNIINSSATSMMVPDNDVCKIDLHIEFTWRVRAVVLVDHSSDEPLEGPWSDKIVVSCGPLEASSLLMYCILFIFLLMAVCLFTFYGNKIWIHCKDMRNVEVKLPPGLTTTTGGVVADVGTHWTPQGGLCIPQLKIPKGAAITDTSHHLTHYIIAADEQLLLEKKREFDSELTDLSGNQSITMNLSNSETASVCNSSNESEISSSTPITTNLNLSMNDDSSSSEKDTCSLRLRNVQTKPTGIVDTNPTSTPQSVWSKGYVTLPAPDKNDQFATGPWSKAMQLKALDGYSQIAVDAKQMQPPTPITSISTGYVPHNIITTTGGQQQPQPMMIIPRQSPQSSSSPNNEHTTSNSGGSSGNNSSASGERPHYLLPQQTQDSLDDDDEDLVHVLDTDLDDIDDIYNLSEQDSPLVDLEPSSGEFSSIETDDLLNIDESDNEISCNSQVGGGAINTANTTTPYVSLATAMPLTASPPQPTAVPQSLGDQKLPAIVDNSQSLAQQAPAMGALPSQSQPSSTNTKPTTPNPYSRIGIWGNTPSSVACATPWPTQSGHSLDMSPPENKEFVVLSQPDGTQHHSTLDKTQPVAPSIGGKTSGYVPHRQFDCKLFKED